VIKLNHAVDWVAGEQIAIASTSFSGREGEQRTIKSIDNTNPNVPVLTLDRPLEYKHFAKTEWYGDEWIDMRAEVGLLTRNVKFRGDP
jgi:cell migration-inducing and hyaluronan-binding protein